MDWLSWLEKREGGTDGTRKYWLYADGKTSKEARWHDKVHPDDHDEMKRGSAKITHDTGAGGQGYFGVTLRNHLSDSQRSHINQQIKENRYHQFPDNISFDHGENENDTISSSKKYYPKYSHSYIPKDKSWESWLKKEKTQTSIEDWTKEPKKKRVKLRMDDDKGGAFDDSGYYNKAWEAWLEKDAQDGKGANDKIKPANWKPFDSNEKTENWTHMKPEDFSDVAHSEAHDDAHKIPKRPSEYSPRDKPRKWKTPKHGTTHTGQEKKITDAQGEKFGKENDVNYNHREDELGRIEHYQRKLRHGDPIEAPSLGVSGGGKGKKRTVHSHEGRHRAEAAAREGEKTIPVGIGRSALRTGSEKKLTSRQVESLRGENTMIGQSERSIRQNVKDGIQSLKSWESWLEKNNAIETDHKEGEKKHEWDGKFSSSTIRDDAKDEKAMDEESDEIMEDAGLEEIEKLKSWESWLEKNADINDHYDDINEKTTRNQEKWDIGTSHEWKYDKDNKEITRDGKPHCTNCDPNAQEMRKKFPKSKLRRMAGTVRHDGKDKEHAWNINPKGHIIDGSRDQFGDEKKIHIIKPNDKKHKEYTTNEAHLGKTPDHLYGRARKKLNRQYSRAHNEGSYKRSEDGKKITSGMESLKAWEAWLTKYEETNSDKELAIQLDTLRQTGIKKIPKQRTKPSEGDDAKKDEISNINAEKWKSWLEIKKRKNQGAPVVPVTNDKDGNPVKPFQKKEVFSDIKNQNSHQNPAPVINSKTPNTMVRRMIDGVMQKVPFGGKGVKGSGDEKTSTKGDKTMSKQLNNKTPAQLKERFDYVTNSPKYQESINRDTELTDEQLEERDAEEWGNTPAGQAYHKKQEGKKKRGFKTASWEAWLTKYEETLEDKKLALKLDEARAVTGKKVASQKVKPETGKDSKMGEYSTITAEKLTSGTVEPLESWALWLDKMQGAGDARFGNQHLTGLDQKPVNNEEDEANILPEKDEKRDEKEEKTNNKPYKVLSDER